MIRHPVWATPVPPVPCAFWSQKSWNKWNWSYKPVHYHGGVFSQWDWMLYVMHKDNDIVIQFYMEYEDVEFYRTRIPKD